MCLLFWSLGGRKAYRLVLAANRDEFLDRPTAALGYLDADRSIIGGRDLRGGGTWLAVGRDGRFAALTNYRDGDGIDGLAPSRGKIILDYLLGGTGAAEFLGGLAKRAAVYAGFNLLVGDGQDCFYFSNKTQRLQCVQKGFYGLSNHLLNTPWPKILRGSAVLRPLMSGAGPIDSEAIFDHLADRHQPADDLLPQTGVSLQWERWLAPIFIEAPGYGTRSSAVLTIDEDGGITFVERTYQRAEDAAVATVTEKRMALASQP